jgi:hypothetical protein
MELPEIAIPTYKRSNTIKTLDYLASVSYPADKITLFVADDDEALLYYRAVPRAVYGKLVVGVKGLVAQRNFITQYYPEDYIYIGMDDDVKKIDSQKSFIELIEDAVKKLDTRKGGLWGVFPNDDKRRYADETTTHLTFIIGSFFVCRNHRDILITQIQKHDYEKSILYFQRYGTVYRYRGAGVSTTYQKGEGGLQEEGRVERMEACVKYLVEKYPLFCSRKDKKGMPDLSLNWRASKKKAQPKTQTETGITDTPASKKS